ncbi:flagellar basal body L-ring protein FlgH [Rubinisphaera margarita]|uniref:flagellar basal body L-ring protein FlgH n=1 Tax=Rubinisphaera margarita TaxID=2909586 RepID=UPI001EE90FD5|nr:flagellar basal body L-ring protein FlgH [Rubinisphaera margarita]MCG6156863.1 flagellar basal body L-ring protein FlgH [Rubinisphaera margarita]
MILSNRLLILALFGALLGTGSFAIAQGPSPFDQYQENNGYQRNPNASPPGYPPQRPPQQQIPQQPAPPAPGPPLAPMYGYAAPPLPPPSIRDFSLIYIPEEDPRQFHVNDIVTVLVSEKSEVTLNSRFNRQRTSTLKAELKEFVRLNDGLRLENSAGTSPTIDANQQERIQNTGQVTDAEGITYRIAATIVDIRPNGNLVLEARKEINASDDLWEYTLHGEVRYEDVQRDNTVLSENIANLNIVKRQDGRVYSSVARRWGTKIFDTIWPF